MTTPSPDQLQKLKLFLCWKLPDRIKIVAPLYLDESIFGTEHYHKGKFLWIVDGCNTNKNARDTELDYVARLVGERMTREDKAIYAVMLRRILGFHQHSYFDLANATWHQRALAMMKMEGVEL